MYQQNVKVTKMT